MCIESAPVASPCATERFSSPAAGSVAKRRLFDAGSSSDSGSQTMPVPMVLVADKSGRQVQPTGRFLIHEYFEW